VPIRNQIGGEKGGDVGIRVAPPGRGGCKKIFSIKELSSPFKKKSEVGPKAEKRMSLPWSVRPNVGLKSRGAGWSSSKEGGRARGYFAEEGQNTDPSRDVQKKKADPCRRESMLGEIERILKGEAKSDKDGRQKTGKRKRKKMIQ